MFSALGKVSSRTGNACFMLRLKFVSIITCYRASYSSGLALLPHSCLLRLGHPLIERWRSTHSLRTEQMGFCVDLASSSVNEGRRKHPVWRACALPPPSMHAQVCPPRSGQSSCDKIETKTCRDRRGEEKTKREHLVLFGKFLVRKQTDKRKSPLCAQSMVLTLTFETASAFLLNFFPTRIATTWLGTLHTKLITCLEFPPPYSRHASILFVLKLGLFPIGIRSKGDTQLRGAARPLS